MVRKYFIDSKGGYNMKMKSSIALIIAGVGGTLLYQQVKNGNVSKMMKKMMNAEKKAIDNLEDMM